MGSVKSAGGRVLASSVVGGTASAIGGGKFANGAITGAYVMLFNEMMHQEEDKKTQEEQQKDGVGKAIGNFIRKLDRGGYADGANTGGGTKFDDWWKYDAGEKCLVPVVQGAVLLTPVVGVPNDVSILFSGNDLFGNPATTLDRVIASVGIVTAGAVSGVVRVSYSVMNWAGLVNKATTGYSIYNTMKK